MRRLLSNLQTVIMLVAVLQLHLQCTKYYTKDLAVGVKEHKTLMNFDGLLYMLGMPMMVLTFGQGAYLSRYYIYRHFFEKL